MDPPRKRLAIFSLPGRLVRSWGGKWVVFPLPYSSEYSRDGMGEHKSTCATLCNVVSCLVTMNGTSSGNPQRARCARSVFTPIFLRTWIRRGRMVITDDAGWVHSPFV